MENLAKYKQAFIESFELSEEQLSGLTYQSVPLWDSVGHMTLIANLEDAFDIMFETDDIVDFSSFEKGMDIMSRNYDVQF